MEESTFLSRAFADQGLNEKNYGNEGRSADGKDRRIYLRRMKKRKSANVLDWPIK